MLLLLSKLWPACLLPSLDCNGFLLTVAMF